MDTVARAALQLRAYEEEDFDFSNPHADGWHTLDAVCDDLCELDAVLDCAAEMFGLMERLDNSDLGSPGPLVHTLESTGTRYQPLLEESVRRKPAPLTVWMVNRILNTADNDDRRRWLDLLTLATTHPLASSETCTDAQDFLDYQHGTSA